MFHRTFNPGPSQVTDEVKADITEAVEKNIISLSHRSTIFAEITKQAVKGLREYFDVPEDYHVLFTSSATEALELVIRNLVVKESFHFTNGNFSELAARISESFGKTAISDSVEWGKQNNHLKAKIPSSSELVMLNYNETSTGVTCDNKTVRDLRNKIDGKLLAVDITSSAGCLPFEIHQADVWLFSVQKGLGLPSGLGIMFVSPKALNRSKKLKHSGLFNFYSMAEKMKDYQTLHTPNVLGIYLLAKQLERWSAPKAPSNPVETRAKAKMINQFIDAHELLNYYVKQPKVRSKTTICIEASPEIISKLSKAASNANLVLGSGYGKIKHNTFRIANFPALSRYDMQLLINTLTHVL